MSSGKTTKTVAVTRVLDGDTFVGKVSGIETVYRLAGVDTPERGQTGYDAAKNALNSMIGGKAVTAEHKAIGHYGRSVVNVKIGKKDVNAAMKKHDKK